MSGNRRDICVNRYNPYNRRNYQNERIEINNYKYIKEKEPLFCTSYKRKNQITIVPIQKKKRGSITNCLLFWIDRYVAASKEKMWSRNFGLA
jgi:hypothetical protein